MTCHVLPFLAIISVLSIIMVSGQDVTTTTASPPKEVSSTQTVDIAAKRKAEKAERKKISNEYQSMYFKMCAETFNKMKGLTEQCSKDMNMDTEEIKTCVKRRMARKAGTKKSPIPGKNVGVAKKGMKSGGKKGKKNGKKGKGKKKGKGRGKEPTDANNDDDAEAVPASGADGSTTTATPLTTTTTTAIVPEAKLNPETEAVIGDNAEATTMVITDEVMQAAMAEETSWRTIWRLESHTVGCFIDNQRKKDDKYKSMKKMEWREEKSKLVMEQLKMKQKCLNDKLSGNK